MPKKSFNEIKQAIKDYDYKIDMVWFILFPIFNIVYFITNNLYKSGFDITIELDRQIPLIPLFILPYVYWYVYMILGYFIISLRNRKDYMKGMLGLFAGMWICYAIYFIFPTEMTRPVIANSNILNRMINTIYMSDRPFNCFPSLHVLGTYFIMRYTKKEYNKYFYYYTQVMGILIILSTLFIKQHFVLDIVSSVILVEIILVLTKKINDDFIEKCLNMPYSAVDKIVKKYKDLMVN